MALFRCDAGVITGTRLCHKRLPLSELFGVGEFSYCKTHAKEIILSIIENYEKTFDTKFIRDERKNIQIISSDPEEELVIKSIMEYFLVLHDDSKLRLLESLGSDVFSNFKGFNEFK